ncbi:MAG: DUF4918 family protein [Fulvivirga sp.]|nr:DUF4918 family protein [Fulvivirga sp.]
MTFGKKVTQFYRNISAPENTPKGVEVLHPYQAPVVMNIVREFFEKYFNDQQKRTFLIGINPGRFGGGITGIPFTDPVKLEEHLDIDHPFDQRAELSSNFVYEMIDALGGPEKFYGAFYITSVCPLGFMKDGKNLNYYDIKSLQDKLEPYMVRHLKEQIGFGARPIAYSMGKGKNIKYLEKLNKKHQLFEDVKPLPHPRWVMQYRLKRKEEFIQEYEKALTPWM